MDDATRVRSAARAAVDEIEPAGLDAVIADRIADASMAPGVVAVVCSRALDAPSVDERAAGVQLVYEGLRFTRELVHEEPWAVGADPPAHDIDADLDVLAAGILVSRGFHLLARTPAAPRAVETVRSFGRDQTARRGATPEDRASHDRKLEADAFALAVATVADAPDALVECAADVGRRLGPCLPPAETAIDDETRATLAAVATGDREYDPDPARPSGDP